MTQNRVEGRDAKLTAAVDKKVTEGDLRRRSSGGVANADPAGVSR